VPKKRKLHKNELNTTFFCSSPPKGSKWLKIFKISLTFRFDKLSNSSKSIHTGENSQILTVSNKKQFLVFIHSILTRSYWNFSAISFKVRFCGCLFLERFCGYSCFDLLELPKRLVRDGIKSNRTL
jgi:hypothetical protein